MNKFDTVGSDGFYYSYLLKFTGNENEADEWTYLKIIDSATNIIPDFSNNLGVPTAYMTHDSEGLYVIYKSQPDSKWFVSRYDFSFNKLWNVTIPQDINFTGYSIAADAGSKLYVLGSIGYGDGLSSRIGLLDSAALIYDKSGNKIAVSQRLGVKGTETIPGKAVYINGAVYATGSVFGSLGGETFSGDKDIFITNIFTQ